MAEYHGWSSEDIAQYIKKIEEQLTQTQQALDSSLQTNKVIMARLMIARDALEFYANDKQYEDVFMMPGEMIEIQYDDGAKAKVALASISNKAVEG